MPSAPFHVTEVPFRPAPAVGADTASILTELGYSADQIEALVASRAVGQP